MHRVPTTSSSFQCLYRLQNLAIETSDLEPRALQSTCLRLEREVSCFLFQQASTSPMKKTSHLSPPAFQSCQRFFWILSRQIWPIGTIHKLCRASFESEVLHEDHLSKDHPFGQNLLNRSSFLCARDPFNGLVFF